MRITALLFTVLLVSSAVLAGRSLWHSYVGLRDRGRSRTIWGVTDVALAGGLVLTAYEMLPEASILLYLVPLAGVAVAVVFIVVDIRLRRCHSGRRTKERLECKEQRRRLP